MSANPAATVSIGVRVPADLLAKIDELCALTERSRTYWVLHALEQVIPEELEDVRIVTESIADSTAHPESVLEGTQVEQWMIENGVCPVSGPRGVAR
jgi:predicted transcriptional regulator